MAQPLDYSLAWQDAKALLRGQRDGVIAIAGALWFFPTWLSGYLTRNSEMGSGENFADLIIAVQQMYAAYWYILLPTMLIGLWGTTSLYALLTRGDLAKNGDALRLGLALLPVYFLAQLLTGWAIMLGMLLFILPGVYLIGRLLAVGAVIVAEPSRGVIGSLRHGWELTQGQGWRIALFFLVIMLITTIAYFVASLFIELPVTLIAGRGGVPLLSAAVEAAGSTVINLLSLAVTVAVYRRLSAD